MLRTLTLATLVTVSAMLVAPAEASACDSGLCVEDRKGLDWFPDASLTAAQIKKEAKKNRKRKASTLYLEIEDGRGSLFIDGRWAGVAPVRGFEIKPGRHDLQVRDGDTVLAEGVLTVPKTSGDVRLMVKHP